MRNRSGRRGSPGRARAGRPLGATSWSRNLANVAAHHAKVLLELWLAEVPVLEFQVLFRQLPHSPEHQAIIEECWRARTVGGEDTRFRQRSNGNSVN
jgi:hypothetical protein